MEGGGGGGGGGKGGFGGCNINTLVCEGRCGRVGVIVMEG